MGLIKSAMGIGALLLEGVGDTIRVSLTDEPEKEVRAGFDILRAAGHFVPGPEVVSCPTCGRTNINVAQIASEVEERLRGCNKPIKVAVMGCVVNGPGEARGADIALPEVRTAPCCSSVDSRCVCCAVISWTSCVKRSNGWCWNNEAHAYAALAAVYGGRRVYGQLRQRIVERVVADRQNKIITVVYRTANPVPAETSGRLIASLEPQFPGFALKVQGLFAYTCLTSRAVLELAEELKDAGLPINGFLSGAQVDISGEHITVRVQNGVLLLTQMEFAVKLEELIAARTGVRPQVALVCDTAISAEAVEEHILKKAPPARQFKAKSEGPAVKVQGLDLEDAPAKLVNGHMFQPTGLTALRDVGAEAGKVTVWGDVFFTEIKGNWRKIYSISITDYTGSINLKIRPQEGENCDKWEELGPGDTLIIKGDCAYDKYERDYVIYLMTC